VDAALLDVMGAELDMGTGLDEMAKVSYPEHDPQPPQVGDLRNWHLKNRHVLRGAMLYDSF
jgi:D-alanyl-D-alanine dipeptidase